METAPKGVYVYQQFGTVSHPMHAAQGRLYALGGLHVMARCEGLTRAEADACTAALNRLAAEDLLDHTEMPVNDEGESVVNPTTTKR